MENTLPAWKTSEPGKGTSEVVVRRNLEYLSREYLDELAYRQCSPKTVELNKLVTTNLLWFLDRHEYDECGTVELKRFFTYLGNGHLQPGGRWGEKKCVKPVSRRTVEIYWGILDRLFKFLVKEGHAKTSPMAGMNRPARAPEPEIKPFSDDELTSLRNAARKTSHPARDEAIIMLLLDTGLRVSEMCSLRVGDLDERTRSCTIKGKGQKVRTVYIGNAAWRTVWKSRPGEAATLPLFPNDEGRGLTRSGVTQIFERLGKAAHITGARCSPHTMRHTYAISFLRNGGNVFALKQFLGHSSLTMTNRYIALAQTDLAEQHKQFSPGDRLGRKKDSQK